MARGLDKDGNLIRGKCGACGSDQGICTSSPVGPFSRCICDNCRSKHILPWQEMVCVYTGRIENDSMFDKEFGPEYIDKFIQPTLDHYGYTMEKLIADAEIQIKEWSEEPE